MTTTESEFLEEIHLYLQKELDTELIKQYIFNRLVQLGIEKKSKI